MTSLPVPPRHDDHRLWLACVGAVFLHLILLFGISLAPQPSTSNSLEVTLLANASQHAPLTARVLAPVAQVGGGKQRDLREHSARQGGPTASAGLRQANDLTTQAAQAPKGSVLAITTHAAADHFINSNRQHTPTGTAESLQLQRRELAGAETTHPRHDIATHQASDDSQGRNLGLDTFAARQAAYQDTWRRYVERAGAANFPWSVLTMGQPKSLVLHVRVRDDGTVAGTRILRSSGLPMLDKAALEILRRAGPFPPFPEGLRRHTQELSFSYKWEFLPGEHAALRVGGP